MSQRSHKAETREAPSAKHLAMVDRMDGMNGLKHEVLQCAKDKIDAAKAAKQHGQYDEAIRLSREASDLADLVQGW
jgi:hypothetical protein